MFAFARSEGGNVFIGRFGVAGMKWLVPLLLLLTAFAVVVPCARAQGVTLTTSEDPVGDAVETTEGTLGDLPSPGSVADRTDAVADTARDAVDSGASPGKAFRSTFDRLPSRLERLLERIELGRNVRANLRRFEQALASLSARERGRVLRLLNAEIRRLRADGVSPAERRSIDRLIRARATMTPPSGPIALSGVGDARARTSGSGPAPQMSAPFAGGVLEASVARAQGPPSSGATPPSDGPGDQSKPSDPPAFPLTGILLALCVAFFVIVGALAIKEERSG
jgi:hypothetical protein